MSHIEILFNKKGLGEIRRAGEPDQAQGLDVSQVAKLLGYKYKLDIDPSRILDFLVSRDIIQPDGRPRQEFIDVGWFAAETAGSRHVERPRTKAYITSEGSLKIIELILDAYNNDYILNPYL